MWHGRSTSGKAATGTVPACRPGDSRARQLSKLYGHGFAFGGMQCSGNVVHRSKIAHSKTTPNGGGSEFHRFMCHHVGLVKGGVDLEAWDTLSPPVRGNPDAADVVALPRSCIIHSPLPRADRRVVRLLSMGVLRWVFRLERGGRNSRNVEDSETLGDLGCVKGHWHKRIASTFAFEPLPVACALIRRGDDVSRRSGRAYDVPL